ncbi:MAG: hypothetical protein PHI96_06290 [Desulfovibrio sp.]|nr:hypothetical protein [Desulfovibrio sp.]
MQKHFSFHWRIFTAALVLALFTGALVLVSSSEAAGASRVTWSLKESKIVKVNNVSMLRLVIYFNNKSSDEKIVSQLYDKEILISGNVEWYSKIGESSFKEGSRAFKYTHRSKIVNKVDIWPGRRTTLYFDIPIDKLANINSSKSRYPILYKITNLKIHSVFTKYRTSSI